MPLKDVGTSKGDSDRSSSPPRSLDRRRFDEKRAEEKKEEFTRRGQELDETSSNTIKTLTDKRKDITTFLYPRTLINDFIKAIVEHISKGSTTEPFEDSTPFVVYNAQREHYHKEAAEYNKQRQDLEDEINRHINDIEQHNKALKKQGSPAWYENQKTPEYYGKELPSLLTDWLSAGELISMTTRKYEEQASRAGSDSSGEDNPQMGKRKDSDSSGEDNPHLGKRKKL